MMRIAKRIKSLQDEINQDFLQRQPTEDFNRETEESSMRSPPSRKHHRDREYEPAHGFGDTRDPVKIATEIEDMPTPPEICQVMIGGRPIDLHSFEDYMVWRISPYQMRTVLRYRTARIMEEIKNYSSSPKAKFGGNIFIMIIFIALMLVIGIGVLMFMPQITAFFKGFI